MHIQYAHHPLVLLPLLLLDLPLLNLSASLVVDRVDRPPADGPNAVLVAELLTPSILVDFGYEPLLLSGLLQEGLFTFSRIEADHEDHIMPLEHVPLLADG